MSKPVSVNHPIKKHILDVLLTQKIARFRDLRPPKTDTNLFTYHLNGLVALGMVDKLEDGYTLSGAGFAYADTANSEPNTSGLQTHIATMLVVQNGEGDILLQRRTTQPYIDSWTLPYGAVLASDTSVQQSAQRVAHEALGRTNQAVEQAGDCYIRVYTHGGALISTTLVHVFRFYEDDIETNDEIIWARPHKVRQLSLAPAVEEIMARTFFKDPFFFEEYTVKWSSTPVDSE